MTNMKLYLSPDYAGGGPGSPLPNLPNSKQISNAGYFPASSTGTGHQPFDIRDTIASFVNRKDKDLSSDGAKSDFAQMVAVLGRPAATKLAIHLTQFNQRSDQQGAPFEKRLQSLYDIGSNDKDVDGMLKRSAMLGYGPMEGARSSVRKDVMSAYNSPGSTIPAPSALATAMINRK